jgi:hypothetical protein
MDDNVPVKDLSGNQKGISNSTIAVLIVLALIMTIIGTLAVINSGGTNVGPTTYSNPVGRVAFYIVPQQPLTSQGTELTTNGTK